MSYATVEELLALLQISSPTALQSAAAQRALDEAATEIDWELGYTTETPAPSPPPALVVGVNLDRAVEHWKQYASPFGATVVGSDQVAIVISRDTWKRHALKLKPLKTRGWGVG